MAIDNKVEVKITADASGVARAAAVAQSSLAKLQGQLVSLQSVSAKAFSFSGLAGFGLSLSAAAAGMVALTRATADYGDAIGKMAKRTGVAAEELSKLQYAAKLSDVNSEALGKGIGNLSKLMAAAAGGAEESGKLFSRFDVPLRNVDGTVRKTNEVLFDLADVFAALPDGPEKTALAMDVFGKKLGADLIPLLNEGSAGLRAMGDEAERLGLVLSTDQALASEQFNDNLTRLSETSKGYAYAIGNVLIPALNRQFDEFNQMKNSTDGLLLSWLKIPFGLAQFQKARDAAGNIERLNKQIDALKAKMSGGRSDSIYGFDDGNKEKLKKLEAERAEYIKLQNKQIETDDSQTAKKRKNIAAQLAREVAALEKLKAIAAGKASAEILKSDKERTDEQLKDAEKLRGALQTAWETSRKEALKAGEDAQKLFDKALGVRVSAKDKADELRNAGLSEDERRAAALVNASDAQGQGNYYAAAAAAALLDGRTKDFEQYQKQAESFLDRAMRFAEQAGDADTVEAVGNAQAAVIENTARARQAEAAALEAQATVQAATIAKLDADIEALKAKATNIAKLDADIEALKAKATNIAITADIAQAEGVVAALKKQLDELPANKTVTVTVNQVGSPAAMTAAAAAVQALGSDAQGLAYGGPLAGSAPHDRADNRLFWGTPGEWVIQRPAVRHYGSSFIAALNAMKLPRFAFGGEIGASAIGSLSVPRLSGAGSAGEKSGGTPLVLDFGKLGRYEASTSHDTAAAIEQVFTRAALAHGRR